MAAVVPAQESGKQDNAGPGRPAERDGTELRRSTGPVGTGADEDAGPSPPTPRGGAQDVLKIITSVGSPIALATALLFYFGWRRSEEQAKLFGADASVFAMSTQDFVLRSVNAVFAPLIAVLLVGLLLVHTHHRVKTGSVSERWLRRYVQALRFCWAVFLPLGFALVALEEPGTVSFKGALLPLCVVLSIGGPVYAGVLDRSVRPAQLGAPRMGAALLTALLTVVVFWQTERWAAVGGQALADAIQAEPAQWLGSAEVYSAKDLRIEGTSVVRTRRGGPDAAYPFSYSGLYLLQRSGGKYFFITDRWDAGEGRLIVLPDTADIRVEFRRPAGR